MSGQKDQSGNQAGHSLQSHGHLQRPSNGQTAYNGHHHQPPPTPTSASGFPPSSGSGTRVQQAGGPSSQGSNSGQGGTLPGGMPYDDPTNLLRVYPFLTYQPTARAAMHFSPHTSIVQPQETAPEAYPEYADIFNRIDRPTSAEDWAMRNAAEAQMREALNSGQSYLRSYKPSTPDSSSFIPDLPPYPTDLPSMPYNFLPSYLPNPPSSYARQPYHPPLPDVPPGGTLPTPDQVTEGMNYLKQYMSDTLDRNKPPLTPGPDELMTPAASSTALPSEPSSSATSTPSLARAMAKTALTPEASPAPSPTKKQKLNGRQTSPTFNITPKGSQNKGTTIKLKLGSQPSSSLSSIASERNSVTPKATQTKSPQNSTEKKILVVEIPTRNSDLEIEDEESEEDDLGWGDENREDDGDWQMDGAASPHVPASRTPVTPGSGKTGERDMRTNLQKLHSLFEDIFEESDSFSAEPSIEQISLSRFFRGIQLQGTAPTLSTSAIEKISRYVARIQKTRRRSSLDKVEWDLEVIGRIFRLLERSLMGADDLNPFPSDKKVVVSKKKKTKGKKEKKPEGSRSPSAEGEDVAIEANETVSHDEAQAGLLMLDRLRAAGLAAECLLTILDTEGLSKQLLSEDLLAIAIGAVKNQISKVIIPVIEGLSSEKIPGRFLQYIVDAEHEMVKGKKYHTAFMSPLLCSIAQSISASLPRISSLLGRSDISFSDQLVIQTVYLAITPLFVAEPTSSTSGRKKAKDLKGPGAGVLRGLRIESLSCLRGVFARYGDQRQWIIEEILTSMGRNPDTNSSSARFQLANGASIHTITALLLQLTQASSFGITARVRKLRASALEAQYDEFNGGPTEKVDAMEQEIRLCNDTVESSIKSARIVAMYLVQRSTAGKSSKSSHDTDYKAILDVFVADLLNVLYRPEWPAAPVYLTVISRILINALEEAKGGDTALKGIALDYLPDIAAKLRNFHIEMTKAAQIPSLDEIISNADVEGCSTLSSRHQEIHSHLTTASRDDSMYSCSLDMTDLIWAQELHLAIKKAGSLIEKLAEEKDAEAVETKAKLQQIEQTLRVTLQNVWTGDDNLFEIANPSAGSVATVASIAISRGRPLQNAFGAILGSLITTMGVTLINLRSKALRGLSTIVTVDPDVLSQPSVKSAIDDRLSDPSAAVRDAAVELVGKYVVQKPSLAVEYYPHLALRVSDSGLAVRKRVIKLLKGIFSTTNERPIEVDICCKLISLTSDNDENIQELATKTVYEMVFPSMGWDKAFTALLLVDVISEYQGGIEVLERGIEEIIQECQKSGHAERLTETVEAILERLTDATERLDIDPLSHVKAIHLLVTAQADLIDVNKAEILLSYLRRKPANTDEQVSNELLLKIFKQCIPSMPRVASSFATRLSEDLIPMISAPSGGFPTLKETVACFCAVANHLTRDYTQVMRILLSCEARTRAMRNEWNASGTAKQASSAAGPIFVFVCASLAEHCNFDKLAENDQTIKEGLEKISPDRPLYEHLFESFLDFTKMPIPQMAPSLCLGSLFRAYPILILRDEAMTWMDGVFATNDTATQARLLTVIHEFLVSEADKKAGGQKSKQKVKTEGKDMDALIGNAADLSESGLSTAVVQRNIQHILAGAKSQHPPTQAAALDILGFTVMKGLYHPLQCLPILIALETSENEKIADRALELHRTLHAKHSTLVNVRFLDFTKASYDYQRSLTAEVIGHRDGFALLSGWYSLIGEKRAWRHDFLKQLCRVFEYDLAGSDVPDVGLVLYICDNLTTLEFKLQEEVMTVVSLLCAVVAQATGLVMILENGTVGGEGSDNVADKRIPTAEAGEEYSANVVIHASIVVALALLTKNHLIDVFGVPEDKCIKYVPGKKTAVGDKPAVRRKEDMLDLSRLSLVRGVTMVDDFAMQRATFLELVHEDGTLDD